jgi:hypothetical protein
MIKTLLLSLTACAAAFGAVVEGEHSGEVRVIPVQRTPEPNEVETRFSFPSKGELKTEAPFKGQIRLEAYSLGFYSDFLRAREIRENSEGQAMHIILDGNEYISINEAIDDIAENEEIDLDQTLEFTIPSKLSPGAHVLRAFPVRSFGECLKGSNCFAATYFYYKTKNDSANIDLSKPYLTYNQPDGEYKVGMPILVDFMLTNAQLSNDGYKVRLTIDGSDKRILTDWVPYYVYGLKKGSHTIKLELLDPQGKVIAPLFNDLHRTIVVKN